MYIREMVKEAALHIDKDIIQNQEIKDYIASRFENVDIGTINNQINYACVNHQGRINFPNNKKPRTSNDERFDFLYRVGLGKVTLYNPAIHGYWEIVEIDGEFKVRQIGDV